MSRSEILALFLVEGLLLGVVGGMLGVVFGTAIAKLVSAIGIPMPPPPGMARGYIGQVRITPGLAGGAFALAAATTLLAAVYPAWKASADEHRRCAAPQSLSA